MNHRLPAVVLALFAAACAARNATDVSLPDGGSDGGVNQGCSEEVCGSDRICLSDGSCAPVTVAFVSPASDVVTNCARRVEIELAVDGPPGSVSALEILVDGAVAASGFRPGFVYLLDCSQAPEGTYVFTARAVAHGKSFDSAPWRLVVDRTPPHAVAWRPDPASPDLPQQSFVEVDFDEAIDPASIGFVYANLVVDGVSRGGGPVTLSSERTLRVATPSLRELLDLIVVIPAGAADAVGNLVGPLSAHWSQPPLVPTLAVAGPRLPYVSGVVPMTISVSGGTPDLVKLSYGGPAAAIFATAGPPFTWNWDTSAFAEGSWWFAPVAYRGTRAFWGSGLSLIVDRTPSRVTYIGPSIRDPLGQLWVRDHVSVFFSEPVDPASIGSASILVTDGAGAAVPVTLAIDPYGTEVKVAAGGTWPPVVQVAVTSAVTDLAGFALAPASATVTVPDWFLLGSRDAPSGGRASVGGLYLGPGSPASAYAAWEEDPAGAPSRVYMGVPHTAIGWALNRDPTHAARRPTCSAHNSLAWSEATSAGPSTIQVDFVDPPLHAAVGGDGTHGADHPRIAQYRHGPDNSPVLAWLEETDTGTALRVSRWDGAAWSPLAGGPTSASVALPPAVEVDASYVPIVAWVEPGAAGPGLLYLARWTPSAWSPADGPLNVDPGQAASAPALALDAQGRPAVAWAEPAGSTSVVRVKRWTGATWELLDPLGGGTAAAAPSLRIDALGRPIVAYVESAASRLVRVARWDSGGWAFLGTAVNAAEGDGSDPVLELDEADVAYVGWSEAGGVRLARHNE